ncbi:hypothetical protein TNCV_137011 [Trichonephila clavipes]|nr:hypothetical protein TNCV_137011 [Trichonephila clavipes]
MSSPGFEHSPYGTTAASLTTISAGRQLYLSQVPVGYWLIELPFFLLFIINWLSRSPGLNLIEHIWGVWDKGVKVFYTALTNLIELWTTALANIWIFIPVERFQKLVDFRRVTVVINSRGGQTRY